MIDPELRRGMEEILNVPLQSTQELIEKAVNIYSQLRRGSFLKIKITSLRKIKMPVLNSKTTTIKNVKEFQNYFRRRCFADYFDFRCQISRAIKEKFERDKGRAKYTLIHEAGEGTLTEGLVGDIIARTGSSCNLLFSSSKKTHSDLFGDLLAAVFSPLSGNQMAELADLASRGVPPREVSIPFSNFSNEEEGFIEAQRVTMSNYATRKGHLLGTKRRYLLGPEIAEILAEIFRSEAFNQDRREFFLRFWETIEETREELIRELDITRILDIFHPNSEEVELQQKLMFDWEEVKKRLNI